MTEPTAQPEPVPPPPAQRRIPLVVWALVALQAALLLSAAMLYPAMYGYDEPPHRPGGRLTGYLPGFLQRMSERFWGGIGLPEGVAGRHADAVAR